MQTCVSIALLATLATAVPLACSSGGSGRGSGASGPDGSTGGSSGSSSGSGSGSSSGSSSGAGSSSSSGSSGGGSDGGDDGGTVFPAGDGAAPPGFWDSTNIPTAQNVMMFKFLNRTNGKYADSEVYWSFNDSNLGIMETHSIADQPTYDMPANGSGRMYFYLCAAGSPSTCPGDNGPTSYYDFIEFTIGTTSINCDTTRVDAFGIKLALDLHSKAGADLYVGEDYPTFAEDRADTFAAFVAAVPPTFQPCAQAPNAPYRILEPGGCGFNTGGANADYYDSFEQTMWTNNGLTIPMPGPNGSGLGAYPDISAAIMRHVGDAAGTFTPAGKLVTGNWWSTVPSSSFYGTAPADYYAQFWHSRAIDGKQYAFPYDDVGGYSSDLSQSNPEYMLVAIGW
jgi:Beta-1,3-glucanase